jgi:purine-nucleoside phosphorylase
MVLIHTALFPEAKPIIEYFRLKFITKKPYRVYKNENIILIITGMGKKTYQLKDILEKEPIKKAINIGIAGCKDKNIEIGTLFIVNRRLKDIPYSTLTTSTKPVNNPNEIKTTLVDMEAKYFLEVTKDIKEVYIFKIVSDHLDIKIPNKRFVWEIVKKNLYRLQKYIEDKR